MAATSQPRVYNSRRPNNKPGPYPGSRGGPKDHFPPPPAMMAPSINLPGVYSNPDMAYALVAIVGCVVDVQMRSGEAYQGVLKAVSPKLSIALGLAHNKAQEASRANTEKLMQLEFADIISVSVLPEANSSLSSKDIFKTDAEISRSNGSGFSKELQPFSFEDDGNSSLTLHGEGTRGWSAEDMFEINKRKFNVESSYDDELSEYTTKLDRSNTKDYQEREERAKKLAQEIELNSDRHGIDDTGTEEELFSSVVRGEAAQPPLSFSKVAQGKATPPFNSGSSHNRHLPPMSSEGSETAGSQTSRGSDEAADSRASLKGPPDINHLSPPSQGALSQSQPDGSSSQEFHLADSSDVDSGNVREGWTSQDSALSLTQEGAERGGGPMDQCGQVELVEAEEDQEEEEEEEEAEGDMSIAHQVEEDSATLTSDGDKEGDGKGEAGGKTTPPAGAAEDSGVEAAQLDEKEKKVRDFRLDPNAKSFSFNPGAKEFVPSSTALLSLSTTTSPLVQSSSSPAVLDPSSFPSLSHTPPSGKKYPNKRGGMSGGRGGRTFSYNPQESMGVDYSGGGGAGGFVYSPTGGGAGQLPITPPNLIRTSLQQVPNQQMVQYSASVPQFVPSYQPAAAAGYVNTQQPAAVMATQQHIAQSPQHQVFAGNQQYSMPMAQHLLQQQPMPGMYPAGTQPQFSVATSLTTPHAGTPPAMMLVQQPGQGLPSAAPMFTPTTPMPMQMAGMPMQQVGMASGGQNPVLTQQAQGRYNSSAHPTL